MQATLDVAIADSAPAGIDAEELLDAVADPRRRRTLAALCELDGEIEVSELAADVCRRESDDGDDIDDVDRRLVAASLHHHHLPYLDDLGIVAYDAEKRSVTLDVDPDDVELRAALDV